MLRILFDQNVPIPLRRFLPFEVSTAYELGWAQLGNGDLIAAAEKAAFDVFLTSDQNVRYQQSLTARRIAIVVLCTNRWRTIHDNVGAVARALEAA